MQSLIFLRGGGGQIWRGEREKNLNALEGYWIANRASGEMKFCQITKSEQLQYWRFTVALEEEVQHWREITVVFPGMIA